MQDRVRVDNTDECHIRKVQPLCDHLGPQQYIDFAFAEARQRRVVRTWLAHRIAIHAQHGGVAELRLNFLFQSLRPDTKVPNASGLADRTLFGRSRGVLA